MGEEMHAFIPVKRSHGKNIRFVPEKEASRPHVLSLFCHFLKPFMESAHYGNQIMMGSPMTWTPFSPGVDTSRAESKLELGF
jgi:hypothetical protein